MNVGWHGHRHRFELEGLAHFLNAIDRNCPKVDSGGLNLSDRKNPNVDSIPSETEPRSVTVSRTVKNCRRMNPSGSLSQIGSTKNHLRIAMNQRRSRCCLVKACRQMKDDLNSQIRTDSTDGPNPRPNHPSSRLSNRPWPVPISPLGDRRLGGRWTCPSATNWKKKDWP